MWPQTPAPSTPQLPPRQPFQTFADRRRSLGRRRIVMLVSLVVVVAGVWLARPLFSGVEARIRQKLGSLFGN
jgi:hypothetical protein